MARYIILLPEGEARWEAASPEEKAAGYEVHGKFAALLAERGHTITSGAELTHSRHTTTVHKSGDGFTVTEGPYAEATEHVTGFYAVETDDLDDLVECCKVLADLEQTLEIRPVVEHGEA
ncbi:YciI family protein [Nocardioides cheoyonin]|uniref:YciI family protein n=1 Tax=Nocardioides cheoyonin TaxID=3156615 RepID=UPI0032B61F07